MHDGRRTTDIGQWQLNLGPHGPEFEKVSLINSVSLYS